MKLIPLMVLLALSVPGWCQKKPLDHTVYDAWQSLGERSISSDGKTVVYSVVPQEGDGLLIIERPAPGSKLEVPRGYKAWITPDVRFVIGRIKPLFKDLREARIKKKKAEDMPRDSLFIVDLTAFTVAKIPNIKSYKVPEKSSGWVAWLADKPLPEASSKKTLDSLMQLNALTRLADSLDRAADSLRGRAAEAKTRGLAVLKESAPKKKPAGESIEEGTELTLKNLYTGEEKKYSRVSDYGFGKKGNVLLVQVTRKKDDTASKAYIGWVALGGTQSPAGLKMDTVIRGFNDAKNLAIDEDGRQIAFVLERDSAAKAMRKFYSCWYYHSGMDSAVLLVNSHTPGVPMEATVSENYELNFSKTGNRLFLGLAPIRPIKDTTIPEFEKAALDIWNYKDDQLQPVQLKNLERDLKRSWLASWDLNNKKLTVYGDEKFPVTLVTKEGDGDVFYAQSDSGKRVAQQWQGFTFKDVYAVDAATGARRLIVRDLKGGIYPSYTGKYLLFYDERKKGYFIYNSGTGAVIPAGKDITEPLYDVENDVPDDPNAYGIAGWEKDDKKVYVYGRYDIVPVDPESGKPMGRLAWSSSAKGAKVSYRLVRLDPEERYIDPTKSVYARWFDDSTKSSGYIKVSDGQAAQLIGGGAYSYNGLVKADSADVYLYTIENYSQSPQLSIISSAAGQLQLSHLNPQQANYLWGSAELVKWKAYTGRETEGILYKPEGFDAKKKYPMIVYYYERNSNTLYNYLAPSPTPSRLNIPFFVSRGYLVFVPDIWYKAGHPGQSAYDYIMSGVRSLVRKGFVDSTKLGLQGQSWGGYQTAYLITRTKLFAAAWAGAPVVNMFSAYGGIRWESGVNRQMQYEKQQSRIGATIWERPDLYTENSPLFHLPAVTTPLVIMSNDADGAVPWYQGIEFFTAMRRLNKPVWLLQYNGEAHNLVERRNRKDIQIREQQFFDWLLKGEKAPKWITSGVPATLKGTEYGLGTN